MAKRRPVGNPDPSEDEDGEPETRDERRARRDREKRARTKRGDGFFAARPRWQKYAVVGGLATAVVVGLVLAVILFPTPCLTVSAPPIASGVPDEGAPSWCANSSNFEFLEFVHLSIVVGGSPVVIPGGIGVVPTARYGFACTMPVSTSNVTVGSDDSDGLIELGSPWAFTYTLSDFFNLWKETYSTAEVNGASVSVDYSASELFNYSVTSKQAIHLYVNNQLQSNDNPGLVLNYYPTSAPQGVTDFPGCFINKYGTNNNILITWGWAGAGESVSAPLPAPAGATGPLAAPTPLPTLLVSSDPSGMGLHAGELGLMSPSVTRS